MRQWKTFKKYSYQLAIAPQQTTFLSHSLIQKCKYLSLLTSPKSGGKLCWYEPGSTALDLTHSCISSQLGSWPEIVGLDWLHCMLALGWGKQGDGSYHASSSIAWIVAGFQERKEAPKASQGPDLEMTLCHFCFILLARASHRPTWGNKIDSTFSWQELQNHGKEYEYVQRSLIGIINIITPANSASKNKNKANNTTL